MREGKGESRKDGEEKGREREKKKGEGTLHRVLKGKHKRKVRVHNYTKAK